MKKLLVVVLLIGCESVLPKEKPFTITEKYIRSYNGIAGYYYQDKVGRTGYFEDSINRYNVGDTLK